MRVYCIGMMKKVVLLVFLALFVCGSLLAQTDAALDIFGKSFVAALAQKDMAALKPLMVTELDARNTLAQMDIPAEQRDREIEAFKNAYPRMEENFAHAHAL